jgi:hypothetical protein
VLRSSSLTWEWLLLPSKKYYYNLICNCTKSLIKLGFWNS